MLGQKEKSHQIYPRQLKIRVAEEVVSGLKGPTEASRDYGIPFDTLREWVKKYRNQILSKETKEVLALASMKKNKENTETDLEKKVRELEEENMRLRKELHHSNLKTELLNKLVELTERTYGISVKKKLWSQTVEEVKHTVAKEGLGDLCGLFGYTRQAYYQQRLGNSYNAIKGEIVLEKVKEKRKDMPRLGARKLLYLLKKDGIDIGRDKLFELLRNNNMLVSKRKRKVFTTQSKHWLKKYPNLIEGLDILKPNKLWVSDITYIIAGNNFAYLFLITDAYSRKILGHCLSMSLEADGGIEALRIALSGVEWQKRAGMIHHSDRGSQYCSHNYVNLLEKSKMLISMTQNGDPYENAIAERVNGVLKQEWIHNETYQSFEQAKERIAEIIEIYNSKRPHLSCDMLTPQEAHNQSGKLKKHWKNHRKDYKQNELSTIDVK